MPPTTKLRVASASGRPLPPHTAHTVDDVLSEALRRRPDLLADVAKLRASDANIAAARSALLPTVSLGESRRFLSGTMNVDNSPYFSGPPAAGRRAPDTRLADLRWWTAAEQAETRRVDSAQRRRTTCRVEPIKLCARSRSPTTKSRRGYSNTTPLLRCRPRRKRPFAVPAIPIRQGSPR